MGEGEEKTGEREGRGQIDRVLGWSREMRGRTWRGVQGQCGFSPLPISSAKYQTVGVSVRHSVRLWNQPDVGSITLCSITLVDVTYM